MSSQKTPTYLSPQNRPSSSHQSPNSNLNPTQNQDNYNQSNYQYVAGLKHIGYVVGDSIGNLGSGGKGSGGDGVGIGDRIVNGLYVRDGDGEARKGGIRGSVISDRNRVDSAINSRVNSRIEYSPTPGVIVHEHPSRPARSPSPISINPNANIIPAANFIYNSPGNSTPQSRTVSYSPVRYQVTQQPITLSKPSIVSAVISNPPVVPLAQYQRCVNECKVWQQRYNQLYTLYLKSQSQPKTTFPNPIPTPTPTTSTSNINIEQYTYTIKQNKKMKERIKQLQRNQQKIINNMEDVITRLVNKYRDSTIKESMLLLDRYRLEKKIGEKN